MNNNIGIHNELNTHIHDQVITLHNLSVINETNNSVVTSLPADVVVFFIVRFLRVWDYFSYPV